VVNELSGFIAVNDREGEYTMTDDCKTVLGFLQCDYELFENERSGDKIITRFNELTTQGKANGFYPLIVLPSDTLAEMLEIFLNENKVENGPESIAAYRQTLIEAANGIEAAAFLSTEADKCIGQYGGYDILGQFVQSEPLDTLSLHMLSYMPCQEVIIAKIPTENPWELAAWIPMGGFNFCPSPEKQVAVFRYWHEKYGAVPAVVTSDIWELTLTKPPLTEEEAEALAKEHFAFCSDAVAQGPETIRGLASMLKGSTMWFFWWD